MNFAKLTTLPAALAFLAVCALTAGSSYAEQIKNHALSLVGKPKYGPDFKHFDYVNPEAPKGGKVRTFGLKTFETLNPFAALKGAVADGLANGGLVYEPLMRSNLEEPSTEYGLIAEWVSYPEDYSSVTFKLRDEAKWHDGKQIDVEDVIYSFNTIIKVHPRQAQYYKNVKEVKKTGDREVTFFFDAKNNRELPQIVGQLDIMPKHYWTGKDKDGKQRDPSKSTLEPPLGSGPYKVLNVIPGKSIAYERVKDYWGKDLPINKGHFNFDQIEYIYYFDTDVAFEAFKAGKLDYYNVTQSKLWATEFTFKSFKDGLVKKSIVPEKSVRYMQAFVPNTRREKFSDPKLRKALDLVFDFEWSNKNLFYGQYSRLSSYFDETELAAKGLPQGKELEILNEFKDKIPPEVFTSEYKSPINGDSKAFRNNLRKALGLLKEAGWEIKSNRLVHAKTDKPFEMEFLLANSGFERVILPYAKNLERLGIKAEVRTVDVPQYKRRVENFDFDIIIGSFPQSFSPGNEQRFFWSSEAADQAGSYNLIGIRNPVIDRIIDKIIFAKDREDLVAATRALDRVLLWNHYVIPHWYAAFERISYWNQYEHPASLNVLSADCLGECLKKAVAEKDKILTTSPGFLSVWWQKTETAKQ